MSPKSQNNKLKDATIGIDNWWWQNHQHSVFFSSVNQSAKINQSLISSFFCSIFSYVACLQSWCGCIRSHNTVTKPSCSMYLLSHDFRFSFSVIKQTYLCFCWVCPPHASVFPFSIQSCRWLLFPTLTCEQRVKSTEVTLVYLPTNLFAFHLTLLTENWNLTILRHLKGENTPPRSYAIYKYFFRYFFHVLFKNGQHSSRATCGVHGGIVGQAQHSGKKWKCSVMVEFGD